MGLVDLINNMGFETTVGEAFQKFLPHFVKTVEINLKNESDLCASLTLLTVLANKAGEKYTQILMENRDQVLKQMELLKNRQGDVKTYANQCKAAWEGIRDETVTSMASMSQKVQEIERPKTSPMKMNIQEEPTFGNSPASINNQSFGSLKKPLEPEDEVNEALKNTMALQMKNIQDQIEDSLMGIQKKMSNIE